MTPTREVDLRPFETEGPTVISFSGGRTSAFMLFQALKAHGGSLPSSVQVVFANTGRERPETLDFINVCATRWKVPVVWLEFQADLPRFKIVDYPTAAREGEPFSDLIRWKRFLPNVFQRTCTQHLKVHVIQGYLKSLGWSAWTSFIGIRYDEPRRWRVRGPDPKSSYDNREIPLVDARVTKAEVMAFWAAQDFDLQLQPWEGNCDLCFLKGRSKIERLLRDRPDLAAWWIAQEQYADDMKFRGETQYARFRLDRPNYRELLRQVEVQPMLALGETEDDADRIDCLCTE